MFLLLIFSYFFSCNFSCQTQTKQPIISIRAHQQASQASNPLQSMFTAKQKISFISWGWKQNDQGWKEQVNSSTLVCVPFNHPRMKSQMNSMCLPSDSKSVSNSSSMPGYGVRDQQPSSFKQRESKDSVNIAICSQNQYSLWVVLVRLLRCILYSLERWNEIGPCWIPGNPTPRVVCHVLWH